MQSPATMNPIVPTEPMLVPSVINRRHVATEHQQKWRKRTQIVNPLLLLKLHPSLDSTPKKQNFTPVNSKIAVRSAILFIPSISLTLDPIGLTRDLAAYQNRN
ncbi:hypothetical protein L2E82_01872 [Cichorium intybus]|uniref:Uncharacterized protein n=1 Tax=Cichorium intybus TaxID=13427 RepID=A0ACB9H163_CICIN|nr:hypothetical protein L2E82_01872 [Cichorium intybus]